MGSVAEVTTDETSRQAEREERRKKWMTAADKKQKLVYMVNCFHFILHGFFSLLVFAEDSI